MNTHSYTIIIHSNEKDEMAGFWAEVPALPGCFTQGETIEKCIENAHEAITGYLETLIKLGEPIPGSDDTKEPIVSSVRVNIPTNA